MKKIKLLLIFGLTFILSGCTVDYNVTINNDLSMSEEAIVKIEESFFDDYMFYTKAETYNAVMSRNLSFLNELNYDYKHSDDYLTTTFNNNYNKLTDYINNNTIYQQFFENLEYTDENNIITIKSSGEFYQYTEDNAEKFLIEDIDINVKIPFDVISSNADRVDSVNDIYTWTITKDDMDKEFFLEIDYSDVAFQLKYGEYIPLVIIGVILLIGISFVYVKVQMSKRKNNTI